MKKLLVLFLLVSVAVALAQDFGSIKAKTAQLNYEKAISTLEKETAKKVEEIEIKYRTELSSALDAAMKGGDLDEANRIKAVIDQLGASEDIDPKTLINPAGQGKLYAMCDDQFEIYINDKPAASSQTINLVEVEVNVKKGDVILVKCFDGGGAYGFSCAFKLKLGGKIQSTAATWFSYTPKNVEKWFDLKGVTDIKPAERGNAQWIADTVQKEAKLPCENIWGANPGGTSYLLYKIK